LHSIILGIDSSDEFLSVGLAGTEGIIISRAAAAGSKNKNMLHQFLTNILNEANIKLGEIEGVAVAIGPGSFTGLRVGLAVAKGICWSMGLPLAGVSSLTAIAHCANKDLNRIAAVKDARREEFYYGAFERTGGISNQVVPDSVGPAEEILKIISKGFVPVGPGVAELSKYSKGAIVNPNAQYDHQGLGGTVALLGKKKIDAGESIEVGSAAPVYVRTPRPKEWKP
jgi:tRNA threonylcarbamoyladenosine biosynthesis protein TsaB